MLDCGTSVRHACLVADDRAGRRSLIPLGGVHTESQGSRRLRIGPQGSRRLRIGPQGSHRVHMGSQRSHPAPDRRRRLARGGPPRHSALRRTASWPARRGHVAFLCPDFPEEERASLESAYREASFRFGRLQARLNTGEYDGEFDDQGLSGRQLSHKLHRWTQGLARFLKSRRGQTALTALRAAQVLLGSLAAFVGVAEPIRELTDTFVETIVRRGVIRAVPSPGLHSQTNDRAVGRTPTRCAGRWRLPKRLDAFPSPRRLALPTGVSLVSRITRQPWARSWRSRSTRFTTRRSA